MPREPIEQTLFNVVCVVQSTPTPLAATIDIGSMIDSFIICNPSVNTASVFFGDANVSSSVLGTIGTGIEIPTGTAPSFRIVQERQLYEVQEPTNISAQQQTCQVIGPVLIPVIVFKPAALYLVATAAAAPVTVAICFFRKVYV